MDKELESGKYSEYKKKSTEGSSGKRTGEVVRIKKSTYRKNVRDFVILTALVTSLLIGGGTKVYNHIVDENTLNTIIYQFRGEVISPETHRTDNNQYFYYDYDDIADRIESMENPDIGYYLFYANTNSNQTDKVMRETRFRSFDQYLSEHNFANAEEFCDTMSKLALLEHEINEKQQELDSQIDGLHNTDDSNDSYGGKK